MLTEMSNYEAAPKSKFRASPRVCSCRELGRPDARPPERIDSVMQHQHAFALPPNPGRQGLLQITTPTELESIAAGVSMREAVDCVSSPLAETRLATG